MEIIKLNIDDIKAYDKNSKKHPQGQIDKIAKSIKEFGFNVPVIVDKDNILIAGHGRVLAAKKLNMSQVPAVKKENLTELQIKAYRIADNRVAESDWEYDFLKEELQDLRELDYDLDITGFDESELGKILDYDIVVEDEVEPTRVDKLGRLTITCPKCGEVFNKQNGKN